MLFLLFLPRHSAYFLDGPRLFFFGPRLKLMHTLPWEVLWAGSMHGSEVGHDLKGGSGRPYSVSPGQAELAMDGRCCLLLLS